MLLAEFLFWTILVSVVAMLASGLIGIGAYFFVVNDREDLKTSIKLLVGGVILLGLIEFGLRIIYNLTLSDIFAFFAKQFIEDFNRH